MATELDIESKAGDESNRKYCWQCDFVTRMHMTKCIVCGAPLYDKPKHKRPLQAQKTSASDDKSKRPSKKTVLLSFLLLAGALSAVIALSSPRQRAGTPVASPGPTDIEVLGDTFLGYSTLWDQAFQKKLKGAQITIGYADELDQKTRSQKLSSGEVDFMVTTINQLFETPSTGKIIAMWDWTRGADRLVLNNKQFPQVTTIQELNRAATQAAQQGELLSIIFAGNTPSEYLSILLTDKSPYFALEKFNIIRVDDSSTAWQRFQNPQPGDNIVAGIFWEPHVTQANRAGYIPSLSSAHVQRSIVDVVVASPQVLENHPDKVKQFVKAYYEHIARRSIDKTAWRQQFESLGGLTSSEALNFLQGVYFFDINCANHWMNGPTKLLRQRLNYTKEVLYGSGRLTTTPNTVDQLYDGRFIAELATSNDAASCPALQEAIAQPTAPASQPAPTASAPQKPQAKTSTSTQTTIAIQFEVGSAQLNDQGKKALDQVLDTANPNDTVRINATFADTSSARALALLKSRATAVEQYVVDKLPTASLQTTLNSGGTESPNIRVSIGKELTP
ncbi:nitrate ABC transporter substrate-binding protein [Acaryochloris sp. IP29b_bin.137]|uniref:nitrate ABC transporter substrate-binding protein n=1 Tax=Acaryochloris sp. IP29b_bin.137 TaxID=2969217 RepID=UPI00262F2B4B|nr:nitrate ABC transporter substrate-binding protein [Acaryochloris sp. IP29b_bin.137]